MFRSLAAFVFALSSVAAVANASPAATAGPAGAAFYTPPSPLPGGRHGDVIWSRPLTTAAALPHAAQNLLVLYHTTSVNGADVAVSGTVAIPAGTAPAAGWPIISWAHGTTGDGTACTPSLDEENAPEHWYLGPVNALLDMYVAAGYAVVQTDYEGQGTPGVHPYLVGTAEGRDVLDMIRAARAVNPALGARAVVMGHSQGGQSALFAAALAPAWVPELKVIGGVALAPASHLSPWLRGLTTRQEPYLGLGFAGLLIRGYASVDRDVHADRILADATSPFQTQLTDRCVIGLIKADSWAGLSPAQAFRPGADLAPLLRQADANEPGSLTIVSPLLMLQGTADTTVSPAATDLLATELCAKRATLTYRPLPAATHNGMLAPSFAIVEPWIRARFTDSFATSNCADAAKAAT